MDSSTRDTERSRSENQANGNRMSTTPTQTTASGATGGAILRTERRPNIGDSGISAARARVLGARTSSPFLQSMVHAADRIAQGPVLDLASSLRIVGSEEDYGVTSTAGWAPTMEESLRTLDQSTGEPNTRAMATESNRAEQNVTSISAAADSSAARGLPVERLGTAGTAGEAQSSSEPSTLTDFLHYFRDQPSTISSQGAPSTNTSSTRERSGNTERTQLSERSTEARRSLERALRDYRVARRALRTHHADGDDLGSSNQEVTSIRYSRLRQPEPLSNAVTSSTSIDPMVTTSIPTAASLRAARLSIQRSSDLAGDNRPTYASVAGSTTARSNARDSEAEALRTQSYRVNIIRGLPHRFEWQRNDPSVIVPAPRVDSDPSEITNLGIRPAELNADSRRRLDASLLRNRLKRTKPEETASRRKAKNTMRYLTELKTAEKKETNTIDLARTLDIDSMKESLERGVVFDLPFRLDELPKLQPSSWLEGGVRWSGEQVSCTGRSSSPVLRVDNSARPIWAQTAAGREDDIDRLLSIRARRHRERIRAERHERGSSLLGGGALSDQSWLRSGEASRAIGMDTLADVERHLTDLLEEEEQRLNPEDSWAAPESLLGRRLPLLENASATSRRDKWPVKVALHEVDWETMTVKGTMSASEIPDRSKPRLSGVEEALDENARSSCVESFFDGEIIDFRTNEIETVKDKEGYKSGGLAVDLQYWAGLGPFREEVERQKNVIRYEKQMEANFGGSGTDYGKAALEVIKSGTRDSYQSMVRSLRDCDMMDESDLNQDENERATDEAMLKCLGSKRWLEEKLGREWILMRWKERCFVMPTSATQTHSATRNTPSSTMATIRPIEGSSEPAATWGLTISGFYYIALHRQTGKIEGLYYDPGSSPYQRLEMWPNDSLPERERQRQQLSKRSADQARSYRRPATVQSNLIPTAQPVGNGIHNYGDLDGQKTTEIEHKRGSGEWDEASLRNKTIGVRKWFPAIDFRD